MRRVLPSRTIGKDCPPTNLTLTRAQANLAPPPPRLAPLLALSPAQRLAPPPLRASRPLLAQPLPSPTLSDDFRKRDLSMALDELAPTLETPPALTNRPWFVSITPTPPVFVFLFRTRNRLQKQAEVRSKWRCKVFFYSFAVMMLSMLKILRALFLSPSVPPRALKS